MNYEILKLDNLGRGITYINNKICFVESAYPGDILNITVVKEKSKYIEGKIKKIISPSNKRCQPQCEYSNKCGGCIFNEYKYIEENKYKENLIKDIVTKKLKLNDSIVKDIIFSNEYKYRNKITLHGNKKIIGLYENKTHRIIDIQKCIICNDKINTIINTLKKEKQIEEVMIRTSNDEQKVIIRIKGNINNPELLRKETNVLIINNKMISKETSIITNIGNKKYYLSSESFFQVNKYLTEKLFDKILDYVRMIKPKNVLDLYCGTGTIGIYISEYAKKIVGIDYNNSNIKDAEKNIELNNINNINFICDKVENRIQELKDFDLIIVDPPRAGLDKKSIKHINNMNSKNIIYVSCNPQTLQRDLNILMENYKIIEITPFNMFPKTYHVESVSVLERNSVEK